METSLAKIFSTCFENSPCIERLAVLTLVSVVPLIRSAMASAWIKSILLLRNARKVNSPGVAMRAPDMQSDLSNRSEMIGLP